MAMSSRVLECSKILCQQRMFQTSAASLVDFRWRKERGLPRIPHTGPLIYKPDYSFVDGRPVPLGMNMRKKIAKQREYATKIVQLCKEINFAVDRHKKMKEEEEQHKNELLQKKLSPKGKKQLES